MQDFIGKGIDKIYEAVGINEESLSFAKTILNATGSAAAKAASILSIIPVDVTVTPGVKNPMAPFCMSVKEVAWTMYNEMMLMYHQMAVLVMKQLANPTELLVAAVMMAVEQIEKMADEQCYKYTGYHILEIYNMCVTGIQLFNMIRALSMPRDGYDVNVSVDVTAQKTELMNRLKAYVDSISIPLQNAFMCLQIKETAMQMKEFVQRCTVMGESLMAI